MSWVRPTIFFIHPHLLQRRMRIRMICKDINTKDSAYEYTVYTHVSLVYIGLYKPPTFFGGRRRGRIQDTL